MKLRVRIVTLALAVLVYVFVASLGIRHGLLVDENSSGVHTQKEQGRSLRGAILESSRRAPTKSKNLPRSYSTEELVSRAEDARREGQHELALDLFSTAASREPENETLVRQALLSEVDVAWTLLGSKDVEDGFSDPYAIAE